MIVKKVSNKKAGSTKSARVAGVANYIVEPELENGVEKCIHHDAENFLTDTHDGHIAEMIALAQDAVRSKDPIDHWVLSWPPTERPTITQVHEAVQIFIEHCGLKGHQTMWGLHDDTKNLHVHIVVNRVHPYTLKVIEINKGFQLNAAHQAVALIEKKQGWKSVENARYKTNDKGELLADSKTQRPAVNKAKDKPLEPTGLVRDIEIQTGQKSAQRIGIEQATPIIAQATSWKELHVNMAAAGLEYCREGSGAKIFIGEIGVKASDVLDRKNNFEALQKRFGIYQPPNQQETKNDPHHRVQLIDNPITSPFESYLEPTGFGTFDTLRDLSRRDLDVTHTYKGTQTSDQNLLQSHESVDHGRAIGVRRGSDRHRAEGGARSKGNRDSLVQPLAPKQPGWNEYIAIRDAQKAAKAHDSVELQKRHKTQREALGAKQKAERTELFLGDWKGKSGYRNALMSITATLQAAEKLELQEQQRGERKALQAKYRPLPMYKQWKKQPQIVSLHILPVTERSTVTSTVASTLRALTSTVDARRHITYQLAQKDVFRDEGQSIQILDLSSEPGIAAALATAQQKYGTVLTLTGSDAFKQHAVALAVANHLTCRFADPQLDQLREQLQQQESEAAREVALTERERERAAAAQLEKARESCPQHASSNNPGEAMSDSKPQTLTLEQAAVNAERATQAEAHSSEQQEAQQAAEAQKGAAPRT